MKGIYSLKIGEKFYIGKDFYIHLNKREKEHERLLKKGIHYNTYLQNAYYRYGETYEYCKLFESDTIDGTGLSKLESEFIIRFDSYVNGYNLTTGGEGIGGYQFSEATCQLRSEMYIGEKNPLSKLTNDNFFEIVEMLKQGKTNKEIAKSYHIHDRYVSLIRHKKRFKNLWDLVTDYDPVKSDQQLKNSKLNTESFKQVVQMLRDGATNSEIEKKFNLASGTGSRIRHKKYYKQWWKKFFDED